MAYFVAVDSEWIPIGMNVLANHKGSMVDVLANHKGGMMNVLANHKGGMMNVLANHKGGISCSNIYVQ